MNSKILISIVILLLLACRKEKFASVLIFGHAGNGLNMQNSVYHDNSKEAIDFALSMEGVNGVELDVQLTKDGKLWLFHDHTLNKETNFNGCISDYTSMELESCHYKTSKKEKVIALYELDFHSYSNMTFILDVRHFKGCDLQLIDTVVVLHELLELKQSYPNIKFLISTNYSNWLNSLEAIGFEVFYEIENMSDFENSNFAHNFIVKNENFTKDEVNSIQEGSKKLLIFEVRSPKFIRKALKKQPFGLITDDLKATIIEKY